MPSYSSLSLSPSPISGGVSINPSAISFSNPGILNSASSSTNAAGGGRDDNVDGEGIGCLGEDTAGLNLSAASDATRRISSALLDAAHGNSHAESSKLSVANFPLKAIAATWALAAISGGRIGAQPYPGLAVAVTLYFLVYCWRTVLWELSNWKKAALAILHFFGYLSKLALAFVFHFVGDPITGFIRIIESSLYLVRDIYFSIIAFAPVPELTRIILFASTILAIGEAAVPDSVNSQPYLLTFAGIIGFGAVKGVILEPFFWLFLVGIFCFSRFIKKRDSTSAALPSAAVLAAIGEPWVRGLTMVSYLALAIVQNSKSSEEAVNVEVSLKQRKLPLPLLLAALSIGIHVAAKWIRYRHLRWMIA